MIPFWVKQPEEKCDIRRQKSGIFSSEIGIIRNHLNEDIKRREFKKRSN